MEEKTQLKKPNYEIIRWFLKEIEEPWSFDFKNLKPSLKDHDDPIERMLEFKRNPGRFDPDCTELTMSIMCVLLSYKGLENDGYSGRHITLKSGMVIETDTANSFISLYKKALKANIPDYKGNCEKLGIKKGFVEELDKILDHKDVFTLERNNDELLKEFVRFAKLTHSIGNFIVGPYAFNSIDSKSKARCSDRFDLFLKKVAEGGTYDSWYEWFSKHSLSTYNEFFFESIAFLDDDKTTIDLAKSKLKDLGPQDLTERIALINGIIETRGRKMVEDLRAAMKGIS